MGSTRAGKASRAVPAPKSSPVSSAKSERDWEAENDAQTIARANVIKSDPERSARAGKAAQRLAEEKRAELRGLNGIARRAK